MNQPSQSLPAGTSEGNRLGYDTSTAGGCRVEPGTPPAPGRSSSVGPAQPGDKRSRGGRANAVFSHGDVELGVAGHILCVTLPQGCCDSTHPTDPLSGLTSSQWRELWVQT